MQTKQGHTKTPWEYHQSNKYHTECRFITTSKKTGKYLHIAKIYGSNDSILMEAEANAAFIVKAVNCHEELVEALKQAHLSMTRCDCRQHIKRHNDSIYQVEQALAKAGE